MGQGPSRNATRGVVQLVEVRSHVGRELRGVHVPVDDFGVCVAEGSSGAACC